MQELLRHSTLRSTLDVYTQAITPAKHAAQAAVVSLVFSSGANGGQKTAAVSDHLNLLFSERAPDVVLIRRYPRQGKSSTNRPWRRQLAQKSWSEDRCGAPTRTPLGDPFAGLVIGREP